MFRVSVGLVGAVVAVLIMTALGGRRSEATEVPEEIAEESYDIEMVYHGIRSLQPWYFWSKKFQTRLQRERQFFKLSEYIFDASTKNNIDPRIAVVIGFRESSLLPRVGLHGEGSRGEKGYFQVMPESLATRTCGGACDLHDPACNAYVAMCFLSHCRDLCGSSPWQYVGGYGRSRCPDSVNEARGWFEVRRARKLLCSAYGRDVCQTVWPS